MVIRRWFKPAGEDSFKEIPLSQPLEFLPVAGLSAAERFTRQEIGRLRRFLKGQQFTAENADGFFDIDRLLKAALEFAPNQQGIE